LYVGKSYETSTLKTSTININCQKHGLSKTWAVKNADGLIMLPGVCLLGRACDKED
jgi:hypothetical protein